jgi:DNA-binding NtrC family response regulator
MSERTKPHSRRRLPVRGIRVQVIDGPDRDKSAAVDHEQLTLGTDPTNDLVLTDPTISRFHLELRRTAASIELHDLESTNGTQVSGGLLRGAKLMVLPGAVLELGGTRVRVDDGPTSLVAGGPAEELGLVGRSAAMQVLSERIRRLAQSDVSVLVSGESGVGKELVARALHAASARAGSPFVVVDCAALHSSLASSELFGHERGSFTGADRQHVGAFERADAGTLFLDEIGELTPELQALLLGALERRRIRRMGGRDEIAIDTRVIAATHRDLRALVNTGQFRLDLFHRLCVVTLHVPSLAERTDDIPLLVEHFAREAGFGAADVAAAFGSSGVSELKAHHFGGNVRELRNVVLGALALGARPVLDETAQAAEAASAGENFVPTAVLDRKYHEARRLVLEHFERCYSERLVTRNHGNVRKAASNAGMDRSYLTELLKRHRVRVVRTHGDKDD